MLFVFSFHFLDSFKSEIFIFLLNCSFHFPSWDPATRLTPDEAFQHEWIQEVRFLHQCDYPGSHLNGTALRLKSINLLQIWPSLIFVPQNLFSNRIQFLHLTAAFSVTYIPTIFSTSVSWYAVRNEPIAIDEDRCLFHVTLMEMSHKFKRSCYRAAIWMRLGYDWWMSRNSRYARNTERGCEEQVGMNQRVDFYGVFLSNESWQGITKHKKHEITLI